VVIYGRKLQENQREFFRTRLEDLINPHHELTLLARNIDWQYFEDEFTQYYSEVVAPSVPIWTMVHFRNRVSEAGIAKIFSYNVLLHGAEVPQQAKFVLSDTIVRRTIQSFPPMHH